MWAWAEAAGVGMQIDVRVKIQWHLVILGLRQWYAVWDRRRSGRWESRETRPGDCEPLAPLATAPAALGLVGSALAAIATPAKNARTQDRRFAKSEHMTPSSVSSANRVDSAQTFDNIA